MDWESAKSYCKNRHWDWSLDIISKAQQEMEELEEKLKRLEDQNKND